ncbi:methylmalonyl Co-A mutase-associated GTPase MeaB [Halobacteriovorax sp. JY17]|uniref:methylmalonyl Co-A mutase-associated GTPase MeaB n=1 Tax=Halobacteriovorax sp. JY17 TaxID=2014617 RepID=UPI000C50D6E9|nr:methylmalonyl Co-A mutase-associated GTPase MeaB [Halobacteriovorax sp. JY17]PIK14135.1 MAG: methylmalonyl Co-A mutase-associated GTPase MeaB [Halobacteriovorax sp. JY17]
MIEVNAKNILAGNRRALAKAITLLESKRDDHRVQGQQLLEEVLPSSGKSIRIGITGTPGVGKSTFIETFGLYLISKGHKVAVLAVDPSSPISGGSIMGDKTRMEKLSQNESAFIRPSPSSGSLGGVAGKTRETALLCEAAGYDVILIETVGVGQSEYEVASMVDFFLVLMLPNAGDELQGIKKGILELADSIVINKVDGDSLNLANQTKAHYTGALQIIHPTSFWKPEVQLISSLENKNIDGVWEMIQRYKTEASSNGELQEKRVKQNKNWMQKLIVDLLDIRLKQHSKVSKELPLLEKKVVEGKTTPFLAANKIVELFLK